jgi:hypothetical protein
LRSDSPVVRDAELFDWTVRAVLAPCNVDYYRYRDGLNAANLVERPQAFADMGAAIERLLPPSEEGVPSSRKAPGKRKPN